MLREVRKSSGYRAAIAAAISRQIAGIDENRALLAGLLQDIGLLTVLIKVPAQELSNQSARSLLPEMEEYGAKVGAVIASKWLLDEEMTDVIRNAGNYSYVGRPPIDLVDVVNIARLLSQVGNDEFKWPPQDQTPCLSRFHEIGLGIENAVKIIHEAREDIKAISRVLVGGQG